MRNILDAATILRDPGDAAEVASIAEVGVAFDWIKVNHPGNIALARTDLSGAFKAVFHNVLVGGGPVPTGMEFYIEADSALAFPSAHKVASISFLSSEVPPTTFELYIPRHMLFLLEPNATHLRSGIGVTGGTLPTVSYGCFLTKY